MTRKIVGYFEGTDSTLLTNLVLAGYDTSPVSNGSDSHGRHIRTVNDENRFDLLIAYVHKIWAPEERGASEPTYQDVFHICRTYGIPLLLEVPSELHDKARKLLSDPPEIVRIVDPADTVRVAHDILEGE